MVAEHDRSADVSRVYVDQTERLVRRLKSLSSLAWRSRRAVVVDALAALEDLSAEVESRQRQALPTIEDHALADAVKLLADDVHASVRDVRDTANALAIIETALIRIR